MAAGNRMIYAVRADHIGLVAGVVDCGTGGLRIRIKGAGWAPGKFTSHEAALRRLLDMRTYTQAEADMARRACTTT